MWITCQTHGPKPDFTNFTRQSRKKPTENVCIREKQKIGRWLEEPSAYPSVQSGHTTFYYCQLSQVATAQAVLVVRGATMDACHGPESHCDAFQSCQIKSGVKQKRAARCSSSNAKLPSSLDKTAATVAAMLILLAAVRPASSSSVFFKGSLWWSFPASLPYCRRLWHLKVTQASFLDAAVHVTLRLPVACLSDLTPTQHSNLHDSMSHTASCYVNYCMWEVRVAQSPCNPAAFRGTAWFSMAENTLNWSFS